MVIDLKDVHLGEHLDLDVHIGHLEIELHILIDNHIQIDLGEINQDIKDIREGLLGGGVVDSDQGDSLDKEEMIEMFLYQNCVYM